MARYLTPVRISTLLLIELYRRQPFETYTERTSSTIFSVIAQQCLQPSDTDADVILAEKHEFIDVLTFVKPLAELGADLPGRPWSSVVLQRIWKLRTVDQLHDLFETCCALLASASPTDAEPDEVQSKAITRASPTGQFIRKCYVEFTRLQFAETIVLWKAFLAFREPSRSLWAQQNPDAAHQLLDIEAGEALSTVANLPVQDNVSVSISVDGIEAVITASVGQLQKLGQRVDSQLKGKIEQWIRMQQSHNAVSLRNFMSFFDSWRAGQYNLALENLHRYFDYAVAKGEEVGTKTHYQYALLHLSVLHADYEHWEESVNSMRECIATARENQDSICLNFALSWLLYLRHSKHARAGSGLQALASIAGEGKNEQEELAFLKTKAREGKHWTLMSSTLLEEARLEMSYKGICAKSFELIWQSSHLNVQHDLHTMPPATANFKAAALNRLGQAHLARQILSALLLKEPSKISLGDRTRAVCRLAYDLAQRGLYDGGIAMLQEIRTTVQGNLKLEQKVLTAAELIGLIRAIKRHDMYSAEYYMTNLRPARANAEPDHVAVINQQELLLLAKQDQLDVALKKVNAHLDQAGASGYSDIAEALSMLNMKASIFAAAGYAQKGFSITLKVITQAKQHLLLPLLIEALGNLARMLNELGEYAAVRDLLQAALPQALEMPTVALTAQLFVTLGEAFVGLAAEKGPQTQSKYTQLLHTASAHIDRARAEYAKIQDHDGQLECLLMKARLARYTDDETTAENADRMYHQVVEQHAELLRQAQGQ